VRREAAPESGHVGGSAPPGSHYDRGMPSALKVMVYSDNTDTRQQIMLALGRRPSRELPVVEYVEVATEPMVIRTADAGGLDLLILDGEAAPAGGMGVCRQLKDELYAGPPILVVVGREQDAWLATWSRADAVVSQPLNPLALAETVTDLLRPRVALSQ
jgi:DNA-binding response OmpR family regulator